jgi:ATP-binding cassette subfamily C protein
VALAWSGAAATAGLIALLGSAVDAVAGGRPPAAAVIAGAAACAVAAALAAGLAAALGPTAAAVAEGRLRRLVVGRVFQAGVAGAAGRTGELLALATESVERSAHYRAAFLGSIIGALTTPFVVLAVMAAAVDASTAGWLALLILTVPLLVGGFQRLVGPVGDSYRRSQARLAAGFLEAIQALETLVYARAADRAGRALAALGETHRRGLMRLLAVNQLLILVVDAAFSLSVTVTAAVLAVTRTAAGQLGVGGGLAVVLMTVLAVGPVDVVGQFFYIGIAGRAAGRRIRDHLADAGTDAPPASAGRLTPVSPDGTPIPTDNAHTPVVGVLTPTDNPSTPTDSAPIPTDGSLIPTDNARTPVDGVLTPTDNSSTPTDSAPVPTGGSLTPADSTPAPTDGSLTPTATTAWAGGAGADGFALEAVTAAWPGGPTVLREVTLRVAPGERVALVGPSGVGKSTVSALLQAHLRPTSGRVTVGRLDTAVADPAAVRARLAVVEQRTFLFMGTVADNLRCADPTAGDDRLWAALELAGLRHEIEALPAGLASPVGEHGAYLSGGQAQRLAIARAALRAAPILILDEPTSQVDLASEAAILAALDRLAAGRTVLVIAHRPGAVLAADRIVALAAPEAPA